MNREHYARMLDVLGEETIARYDREESGLQYGGGLECEDSGGYFTFGKLGRDEQIDILYALGENLPTMTTRPNTRTGTSYALKHMVERYIGRYTSNLQAKTAMRILGYKRSAHNLNPFYNVTVKEWRTFDAVSRMLEHMS